MRTLRSVRSFLPLLTLGLIAGCLGQESGIDNRHILGVAIIPPIDYIEVEASDESANNEVANSEFVDFVGYQYIVVHGVLSTAGIMQGDFDFFNYTSGVEGAISFDLVWGDGEIDFDLYQVDVAGNELQAANAAAGFEHLDITVEEEADIFLQVKGKEMPDGYDGSYSLVMRGIEPNEVGEPEDPDYEAGMEQVLIGAYTHSDSGDLGNPVSGTSILSWNEDIETYQYWSTFDMYIVQRVEVVEDVFVDPELEDGIDNNCDGLTDRGLSEDDKDEDGARVADGDCDDTDPTVRPGWADNFGDGVDGDCDGWADNGLDGLDGDGDGQSEFDGDCNDTDATIYSTLLGEDEMGEELGVELLPDGKDNNCDGTVDNSSVIGDDDSAAGGDEEFDWPDDADGDGQTVEQGDCNDADPTIFECDPDAGEVCYDYRDGKDNDCDAIRSSLQNDTFDENFEYICADTDGVTPITGCSPTEEAGELTWDPAMADDADGDGYSENFGDCNDTNDNVHPGNYELITEYDINSDIDKVWLYGGTFGSLNATGVASGDLLMSAPQELNMSEIAPGITWQMDQDWMGEGGTLIPAGMPQLYIDLTMPPLYGLSFADAEPNDCDLGTSSETWGACAQDLPGAVSADGYMDRVLGTFETIVADTWDGDNDTYHFVMSQDGYLNGELDWDTEGGDMDWYMVCYFGNEFNPWGWYFMSSDTVDLSKPETGTSVLPMPEGTECYAWTVGYSGPANEAYKLKLWITPEEV